MDYDQVPMNMNTPIVGFIAISLTILSHFIITIHHATLQHVFQQWRHLILQRHPPTHMRLLCTKESVLWQWKVTSILWHCVKFSSWWRILENRLAWIGAKGDKSGRSFKHCTLREWFVKIVMWLIWQNSLRIFLGPNNFCTVRSVSVQNGAVMDINVGPECMGLNYWRADWWDCLMIHCSFQFINSLVDRSWVGKRHSV